MNRHTIFKTPAIPVIMMIAGLNHLFEDLSLSVYVGIGIYLAATEIERMIRNS